MVQKKRNNASTRSINKAVKNALNKTAEVKHRLVTTNGQVSDAGYAVAPLDFIVSGSTVNQRIGSRITAKSLYLNGRLTSAQGPNPTNTFLRYFCVETRRPLAIATGTAYDIRPLFDATASIVGKALCGFDYDWVKKVHWNKVVYLNANAEDASHNPVPILKRVNAYKKLNLECIYDQDTSAPAVNYAKTYLYYGFVQDASTTTTHTQTVLKIRYTDM